MKICCSQEHYGEVVQYTRSINDKTLENYFERLEQWEKNENHPCEVELYYGHAPCSFGFCERYPDGDTDIVGGSLYHGNLDESFAATMERFHGWSICTQHMYDSLHWEVSCNMGFLFFTPQT